MPDSTRPFWIDWEYDRDNADTDTTSRYGNYLRQDARWFTLIDFDEPAVAFAATAWKIATGPVMSPPLVRSHERILGVNLQRSQWDGGMLAAVRLATGLPAVLVGARTSAGRWYRGWGDSDGLFRGDFEFPAEEDLAKGSYLFAETQVQWQIPAGTLRAIDVVPSDPDEIFRLAVTCVKVLVAALNREVGPLLERLEG